MSLSALQIARYDGFIEMTYLYGVSSSRESSLMRGTWSKELRARAVSFLVARSIMEKAWDRSDATSD